MEQLGKIIRSAKWMLLALVLVSSTSISGEHVKMCSREDAKEAEATTATISSWEQLYFSFKKYGHCDDGAIGEGFSEAISVLMAEKWSSLNQLAQLAKKDSAFRQFVIQHLDETIPIDRLKKIKLNAESNCDKTVRDICRDVLKSSKCSPYAIRESPAPT